MIKSRKQPRSPSTEEQIEKVCYIYTMEYYWDIKNNNFMNFVGKRIDLENIIPSELTQTEKDIHGMDSMISSC